MLAQVARIKGMAANHRDRIPLPPVLLSVVPFVAAFVCSVVAINLLPWALVPWSGVSGLALGFTASLLWLSRRVR